MHLIGNWLSQNKIAPLVFCEIIWSGFYVANNMHYLRRVLNSFLLWILFYLDIRYTLLSKYLSMSFINAFLTNRIIKEVTELFTWKL